MSPQRKEVTKVKRARVKPRRATGAGTTREPAPSAPMLRNSEVGSFNHCPQAWAWGYGLRLRHKVDAPPLRFGTLVHKALERRYPPGLKRGPHPAATFRELYEAELVQAGAFGFKDEDGKWADAGTMGEAILTHFVDVYGTDSRYKVLASEMPFQLPVYEDDRIGRGSPLFIYTGIMDGLWYDRQDRALVIHDWKTAASIRTDHLPLDPQAGGYWTFGQEWLREQGLLKPDQILRGMLYTFLRKASPDPRPRNSAGLCLNKNGSISEKQPAPYFQRFLDIKSEAQQAHCRERTINRFRQMQRMAHGEDPVVKTPGAMTCGRCGHRPMCILHDIGADWEGYRDATMIPWDPYEAHEIQEGET